MGRCLQISAIALAMLLNFGIAAAQTSASAKDAKPRTLDVVATAHLDTQWRWTIRNSINEYIPNTFRDNYKLIMQYPDYVFSFEGAFRYMVLKEYYPDYYAKLKKLVADGRWRVTGSWVDAVDVNIPSFESLVRQTLYGNGFYKSEFGKTSRDIFLPDCFGFGYALPSIAAHCGLKSFSTQKLTWGSSVGVPFDIGLWEGVDGSTLIAGLNPGDYVSKIRGDLSKDTVWLKTINRLGDSTGLYAGYHYFGTGDTGGGPDSLSVDWLEKSLKSDGPIKVKSVGADDIIELVAPADKSRLPHFKGELLMTHHGVGCYSSQAAMKRWNRKNEQLGDAAERASVAAHLLTGLDYPRETLRDTWVRFLWHQFHDDLTGTSIPEAYEFSWSDEILCQNRFAGVLESAVESTTPALNTQVKGTPLVVFNPIAIANSDAVDATIEYPMGAPAAIQVFGSDGKEVPSQIKKSSDRSLDIVFTPSVPSVGYSVYDVRSNSMQTAFASSLAVTSRSLENQKYLVKLNDNGDVSSIFDKIDKKELLTAPIEWQLLFDKPKQWPAWEIGFDDISAKPARLLTGPAEIKIVENGPARIAIQVVRKTEKSVFKTTVSLSTNDRIEFDNEIDWYERETLLKVAFPVTTPNDSVTYDLGLGAIKRGLNKAKLYEVPGHQWADISAADNSYGISILNDCKYGWDHPEPGILRLSLIHTPGVYESWNWVGDQSSMDNGHHTFKFAIYGHAGALERAGTPWQAAELNQPMRAFQTTNHLGSAGTQVSLLTISAADEKSVPTVFVNAVKLAENSDEIIVRVRELSGKEANAVHLSLIQTVVSAREVNGAEDEIGKAEVVNKELVFSLKPYQPKAFAVKLSKSTAAPKSSTQAQSLTLPFNSDGISTDIDRHDGDLDGKGNTLSGEMLPDTLFYQDIPFTFGLKSAGAKNMVACNEQTVKFPVGNFNRLYLLTCSVNGPVIADFLIDRKPVVEWVQDYSDPLGQWNNRMVGGRMVEEPDKISPAYINRDPVAWYCSHRHNAKGENEAYQFTYIFALRIDLPKNAKSVTFPMNPNIKVLAATIVNTNRDDVIATEPLYDVANATLTRVQSDSTSFVGHSVINLSTPIPGAEIHYTLDGQNPELHSAVYHEPITVTKTTTLKARAFLSGSDDRYVTEATLRQLIPRAAITPPQGLKSGLSCKYFEGSWSKLPNFDSVAVLRDTVTDSISLLKFCRKEDFGLTFKGFVNLPKDGLYEFAISSDDGSKLYIDDSLVVDNDGLHGSGEVPGQIALKAGYHAIFVPMFQAKGDEDLSVSVSGPALPKRTLSKEMLSH